MKEKASTHVKLDMNSFIDSIVEYLGEKFMHSELKEIVIPGALVYFPNFDKEQYNLHFFILII